MVGESQWFQPTVRNRLGERIVLGNFLIKYGKFYDIRDPYNETVSAQGTQIPSKDESEWGHCGRASSPTGTEGYFDVQLEGSGERIATIYWDCPYIGSNKLETQDVKAGYIVSINGFNIPSGPLGKGTITVIED